MLGYTPAGSFFPKLGQGGRWHRWRRHGGQVAAGRPRERVGNARAPRGANRSAPRGVHALRAYPVQVRPGVWIAVPRTVYVARER